MECIHSHKKFRKYNINYKKLKLLKYVDLFVFLMRESEYNLQIFG